MSTPLAFSWNFRSFSCIRQLLLLTFPTTVSLIQTMFKNQVSNSDLKQAVQGIKPKGCNRITPSIYVSKENSNLCFDFAVLKVEIFIYFFFYFPFCPNITSQHFASNLIHCAIHIFVWTTITTFYFFLFFLFLTFAYQ